MTLKRNIHLIEHHKLGVKEGHGHNALRGARQGTLAHRNREATSRNMTMAPLTQLRVSRLQLSFLLSTGGMDSLSRSVRSTI